MAAQFFYVGAQVGVWSYLIRYAQRTVPGTPEKTAANFLIISLVLFMVGRFVGTGLMRRIAPARLLAAFSLTNIVLTAVAIGLPGKTGLYALFATSFFMSVMFPTIFALGLRGLGEMRTLGSSFLVMSIVGGRYPHSADERDFRLRRHSLLDGCAVVLFHRGPSVCQLHQQSPGPGVSVYAAIGVRTRPGR